MSEVKRRVTVTLDPDLLATAESAVESGEARSISAWVNDAIAEKKHRQERARILIRQDVIDAKARDPEEYERARAWALRITGGDTDEVAE
ncbi:hypothetical protein ACFO4E_10335 [Nocardiopsis mangrovi]|uniref:CopG family transcriptional regulator n=1 Tax=Nocardiopsis mangrovi TaxID=1179818 RepID=A0ABV9DVT7_9ACTN